MKTLFINPPNAPITSASIWIEPIDVLTIATYAQSLGHVVSVLDMDRDDGRMNELSIMLENEDYDAVVIVHDYHIPLFQDWSQKKLLELVSLCKKYKVKVVIGWKLSTYAPRKILMNDAYPDVIISKEMEMPIKELLATGVWTEAFLDSIPNIAYRSWDEVIETIKEASRFDIRELPIPDRKLLDVNDYIDVRTMLSSRWCSFRCSFCSVPDFWWKRRAREACEVVEEIAYLYKEFWAKKVLFLDDNATIENERMREISRMLINLKLDVKLGCLGNLRHFDEETMRLMYEAGFAWIHYWVESGSEKLLKSVGKFIPKEQVRSVIQQTKKIWFRVRTSWIMDLPGSTIETAEETAKFIMELEPHEIRLHYLSIRFGSRIFNESLEKTWELPKQYIHGKPVVTKGTSSEIIDASVQSLTEKLRETGYSVIYDNDENAEFENRDRNTKIASFCPLRYGIWWE
ncbi:MAG: Fe-S oxidoreductase [uncultured bacterium (gcode 4)]|uniref:Fe-S oxidoreductase n=1 Tax=uncultured bacterium (gcode 4) TaxID=1234023 RepID=K2GE81_9BACT|nr:MAG: Fe-S oxidoreductase [uncultured bacterium (gcode 4)]